MEQVECAIVGGGPAGLAAATYLARFRRKVVLFDRGGSRAALIPLSHNIAAFPEGISGPVLLARMAKHAERYGADLRCGNIASVSRPDGLWRLRSEGGDLVFARSVLFATGVDNKRLDGISDEDHEQALALGKLRYCPICDGLEAAGAEGDARIGVVGANGHGVAEALFLRHYSQNVILFTQQTCELHEKDRYDLERSGVAWDPRPVASYDFSGDGVTLRFDDGSSQSVDTLYPALGSEPNLELIGRLGLRTDPDGCMLTDERQRLGLEGLYAAGDIVSALDQVAVAVGHAAVAATTIHNDLREQDGRTPA